MWRGVHPPCGQIKLSPAISCNILVFTLLERETFNNYEACRCLAQLSDFILRLTSLPWLLRSAVWKQDGQRSNSQIFTWLNGYLLRQLFHNNLLSYKAIFLTNINTCPSDFVLTNFHSKCGIKHPLIADKLMDAQAVTLSNLLPLTHFRSNPVQLSRNIMMSFPINTCAQFKDTREHTLSGMQIGFSEVACAVKTNTSGSGGISIR